ncbi:MAG TPA: hypothetical protein VMT86_19475 [Bryobacteraceae bacterium]|nr:hypothetical protein [Bryobacteraceae bacterium]
MDRTLAPDQFARPPREVAGASQARVLLASAKSQIGWLILGFGSIMFWGFTWNADVSGWRFRAGQAVSKTGQGLSCKDTGFSEGGSKHRRGTPIYETRYRYEVMGRNFEGASFATGRCAFGPVAVEYLKAQPEVSRIAGMRRRPLSAWALLTALIPATGIALILAGLWEGRTRLRLLREGLVTTAKLIEKKWTNLRSNNRQVYRLTFEYSTPRGTGRVTTRTNRPGRFEREPAQLVFYDPEDLNRAVLAASIPGSVTAGQGRQPVVRGSWAYLLLPGLVSVGNVWYVVHRFMPGS